LELARLCNLKGIAMAKSGSFAAAEKLYKNAMKFLPDDEVVYKLWFNLGLSMKLKKDYKKALFYFEKAKKSAPNDFEKVALQIRIMKDALALTDGSKRV
jgi:Flp pilus assembly protein TadD